MSSLANNLRVPSEILRAARKNLSKLLAQELSKLKPKPRKSFLKWLEDNAYLPSAHSDVGGRYDFHYAPAMEGIAVALDDDAVTDVYCLKAAQVTWTTLLIFYIFYRIDQFPSFIIGMFSALGAAKDFSQEKLDDYVKACPPVAKLIDTSGGTRSGTSLYYKPFVGGALKLIGSNAVRSVKSTSCQFVFVEEPDDASNDVNNQGDSVQLLFERTKAFELCKRVLGGTPSEEGFSRVEQRIKMTDQCVLPVVCHECGQKHVLDFSCVTWDFADESEEPHDIFGHALPDTAVYNCPNCPSVWDSERLKSNVRKTVVDAKAAGDKFRGWIPTKKTDGKRKGFMRLGELYSCLPSASISRIVEKFLEGEYYAERGDETKRKSFVNNQLGKAYAYKDERPNADAMRQMCKDDAESRRDEFVCPARGLLVTAGIDIQRDRIAISIDAWGRNDESWRMYWGEISAEVSTIDKNDPVWASLDSLVFQPFQHERGSKIFVSAISIDSSDGVTSDAVYEWVRTRQRQHSNRLIMAIKGSSSKKDPEVFVKPRDVSVDHKHHTRKTKAEKLMLKVFIVGTNKAKDWISAQIQLGKYHWYQLEQMRWDYFDQMCGEAKVPGKDGRPRWKQKNGQPIEAWDCSVYARHAAMAKRVHLMQESEWLALEGQLIQTDLFSSAEDAPPAEAAPRRKRRKSNYWN